VAVVAAILAAAAVDTRAVVEHRISAVVRRTWVEAVALPISQLRILAAAVILAVAVLRTSPRTRPRISVRRARVSRVTAMAAALDSRISITRTSIT
jgi:hypothetical protein